MDTSDAFRRCQANRNMPKRVFDWDRAAELIRDLRPAVARAGLGEDWEWTGGEIYRDGAPVPEEETYVYLSSNWAIPELELDGRRIPCWRYEHDTPHWFGDTYWPESALTILGGA